MKKVFITILLMFFMILQISAEEYVLKNIPPEYLGTYLPVDYIELLLKYRSHEKALLEIHPTHYDILRLEENRCYSAVLFSDGFAIEEVKLKQWQFSADGSERYITDENGYLYKMISKESSEIAACEFVLKFIFGLYPLANTKVDGDAVRLGNKVYKIEMHPNNARIKLPDYALRLYIFDKTIFPPEKKDYFVMLAKDGFKIVKGINVDDLWVNITDEVEYSYKE